MFEFEAEKKGKKGKKLRSIKDLQRIQWPMAVEGRLEESEEALGGDVDYLA